MTKAVADETGNERLPSEDIVYELNTFGADFTVDGLIARFDRGYIYRPTFKRNYVWFVTQASRFIESILLGLPVPSVFLYKEEDTPQHLIVESSKTSTAISGAWCSPTLERPEC